MFAVGSERASLTRSSKAIEQHVGRVAHKSSYFRHPKSNFHLSVSQWPSVDSSSLASCSQSTGRWIYVFRCCTSTSHGRAPLDPKRSSLKLIVEAVALARAKESVVFFHFADIVVSLSTSLPIRRRRVSSFSSRFSTFLAIRFLFGSFSTNWLFHHFITLSIILLFFKNLSPSLRFFDF